ncbi:NSFL1 cofactor p47 [Exaiptasia diaphana]|uniref:NSFL1 cofactor p47 n=1 Tax=Exaiptasia diaphana TaxID=2652724 RepID=A0A913WUJ5_EXADI|nr:NSFL1 cofactor p47 [Exaiptasia diaphana]
MADEADKSRLTSEFSDVTGASSERAQFFLESSGWQLHIALSSFTSHNVRSSSRIATMASYKAREHENDSDEEQGQAFYAGGSDTSGQQILGPSRSNKNSDIAQDIFEEAKRHGAEEVHNDEPGPRRQTAPTFTGAGYRLGDTEGGPSQQVAGTSQPANEQHNREVILKFWSNGYTVDDGELLSFDDPNNKEFLDSVKKGEIPKELYRLSRGGEVHVNIEDHRQEEYTPPKKKKIIAFVGKGQKLGSPTPTVKFSDEKKGASSSSDVATVNFDQSKPSTSIQIRLADGTRLVSKFNHDQTVGDVRAFITAARPQMAGTSFVLMTTFPNKELMSNQQTIQEANLLNAVIVQRLK